jgi:hypothetical protein
MLFENKKEMCKKYLNEPPH